MKTFFDPQIIFIYNSNGNITKTLFLTFDEKNLLSSKQFQLYEYYKNNIDIFINDDYEVINNHVLLTLTIGEIRGYIRREILHTELNILVFSLWNNIDYVNKDNSIFNPFDLENQIYEKVSDNILIYKIYNQVAFNSIFCILDEDNILPELCSPGIYKDEIYSFVNSIMTIDKSNLENIEIVVEKLNKIIYNLQWSPSLFYELQNLKSFKKTINETYLYYTYISGDNIILLNDYEELYNRQILVSNDKNEILKINNNTLEIYDIEEYNKIILVYPKFENLIIKQKVTKQNIRIDYNISIGILVLDYNLDFFIEETKKTKNIFLDRSKSINIITSNNHTYFSTYQSPQINLYVYIIKIIICIQILKNKVKYFLIDKKKGNRYFSRYCQGIRNPEIINIKDVDLNNYNNFRNIYYENKNNTGDIFYNQEIQQYVMCKHKNIYNIGFIKELYQGYNICFPCCYKKKKDTTAIFKNCIFQVNLEENITYDPYIHIFKQYRVIVDYFKLSLLLDKIDKIFNPPNSIFYSHKHNNTFKNLNNYLLLNKYNKIELAKKYVIYTTNKENIDFKDFNIIKENLDPCLYFFNNEIYFNPNIINNFYKDETNFVKNFTFYLIIQNKIHVIKSINKETAESKIVLSDIDFNLKKQIIRKYILIYPYNKYENFEKNISTKYLYKFNNISLKKESIGYYIVNVLYKNYFKTIYPINDENINLYKITFLVNLLNISKININLDLDFNIDIHKNILKQIISFLNINFIEKKELIYFK